MKWYEVLLLIGVSVYIVFWTSDVKDRLDKIEKEIGLKEKDENDLEEEYNN